MTDSALPDVSVLLAVHNGERYLETALRSVMDQTLRNIEIVVVDDCSGDASPAILTRLAAEDPRIRIFTAPENLKLAGALNFGLEQARAPYVARMDDDDFAFPDRLEVQKRYLDAHPDITLVGSSIEWMNETGETLRRSVRSRDSAAIRWSVRFALNVSHPTFMFRPAMPDGSPVRYDRARALTEDHDLVCRLLLAGGRLTCLPDVLLRYRHHAGSASRRCLSEQMAEAREICTDFQNRELPADVVAALAPLRACYFDFAPATPDRMAGCFAGARVMLAHDVARDPDRAAWLRRQTAQLLSWSLKRGGASSMQIVVGFAKHGRGLLPALVLRALETKLLLPKRLHSDPVIPHFNKSIVF